MRFRMGRNAFPDPQGMMRRLKAQGLKICVWINPYIAQLSPMFDEGVDERIFAQAAPMASVWQADQWQPGMAYRRFHQPAAVRVVRRKLRALLEMGVDCFKTDFGERIPDRCGLSRRLRPGADAQLSTPISTTRPSSNCSKRCTARAKAVVFARSATAGCQKFPVHWGGDCDATFESMAESLRGGL